MDHFPLDVGNVKILIPIYCPHCGSRRGHLRRGRSKSGRQEFECKKCGRRFTGPWPWQKIFRLPSEDPEDPPKWGFRRAERERICRDFSLLAARLEPVLSRHVQASIEAILRAGEALREIADEICPRCEGRTVRDGRVRGKARRRCRDCGYRYVVRARWRRLDK